MDEEDEDNVRTVKKQSEMLFVRGERAVYETLKKRRLIDLGDSVVLISPQQ